MKTARLLLLGLALSSAVAAGTWFANGPMRVAACEHAKEEHAIAQRAADICTSGLIGCSLSIDQIEKVLRLEVRAARACK